MRALPRAWAARFPRAGSPQTDFLSDKFQACMLAHFPLTDRFNRYSPSCHLVPFGGAPAVDHSLALKTRRGGEECGGRRRTAVCLLWRTGDGRNSRAERGGRGGVVAGGGAGVPAGRSGRGAAELARREFHALRALRGWAAGRAVLSPAL